MQHARLAGKIALISGGAGGIGLATARHFADLGARVVIGDIDVAAAEAAVRGDERLASARLDVTDDASWRGVVDDTLERYGGLDVLVNNAGIASAADIEHVTLEEWRRTFAVNVEGVFLGCRHGVRAMKARGGSIVNMSSIAGIVGGHNLPAYNASKGAVRLLTKSVALHCARKRYGIRCNSVHPTFVETPMYERFVEGAHDAEALRAALVAQVPLGRIAQPSEIAALIAYLASDESQFVTGAELIIDGGMTAGV
jgi:NAD(P)-dependent dehydrogenase (short-subunit alcohol dehydrogenase family)